MLPTVPHDEATGPRADSAVSFIVYALPHAEFYRYLRSIVESGFGNRVMFGSDQMVWPEAIARAIEGHGVQLRS